MSTANLYLVTASLRRLLDLNVRALLLRQSLPTTLDVTSMPPERVGAATNTLNLHLYHLLEDAHHRNVPTPGRGGAPVSRQPLALSLYYILTTHHEINDVFDAEVQQRNFGLALKTLHDHSWIDDTLAISPDGGPPQIVMAPGLIGGNNRIEISQRPLTAEESMAFWSAEQNSTTRLSAYFEVRTIFLEPELPTGASGTVFDLGVFLSVGQAPSLRRAAALSHFTPPPGSGFGPQTLDTAPARATLQPGAIPPVNRVQLQGSALAGDGIAGSARVLLRTPSWRQLTPPRDVVAVDAALNPAWNVQLNERAGQFDLQGQIMVDDGGGPISIEVTPGIYAVSIETRRRRETTSGVPRISRAESNQIAISVGARIASHDPANAFGRIVVHVINVFDLTAAGLEVQLALDGVLYDDAPAFSGAPAQDRGLFVRQPGRIELHPLFDPSLSGSRPLRLIINGAESQPFWVLSP